MHKGGLSKTGDDSLARVSEIKGELMMIYGRQVRMYPPALSVVYDCLHPHPYLSAAHPPLPQDPHVPAEARRVVYDALLAAGTNFQWIEVNGQHAFMRDENSYGRYDGELALTTYDMAVKLFNRRLGGVVSAPSVAAL